MKTKLSLFLCLYVSLNVLAQVQIGNDIDGDAEFDAMGWDVAITGDGQTIVVGAPDNSITAISAGQVKIFDFNGSDWVQRGSDLLGALESDRFGRAVDISDDGNTVVVGAQTGDLGAFNAGYVQVFEFDGTDWIQKGFTINGANSDDEFGTSVAISGDGNRVAVGAPYTDTNGFDAGIFYVFDFVGDMWSLSFDHIGDEENDVFGMSLDMSPDGHNIICGAWINEDGTTKPGYAKVFQFDNSSWSQVGATISGDTAGNFFGASSSISDDGNIIAIGSWGNDDNGTDAGEVQVFEFDGNAWQQKGSDIRGGSGSERFGWAIDLSSSGDILAVGAPQENDSRVFKFESNDWMMVGNAIPGETINDDFGFSIALSSDGSRVVIGDPNNDQVGSVQGFVQVYDLSEVLYLNELSINEISIFPNPTNSELKIVSNDSIDCASIYDINGRKLKEFFNVEVKGASFIDVSQFNSGIYFLHIESSDKQQTIKFIKN